MASPSLNRAVAVGVFLLAVLVYFLTMAPTVVFWDVGEFIAAAKLLQVPHPPGAPLFILLVHESLMIPFAADPAVRAHALSAVMSALAVALLYLVIVRSILRQRPAPGTLLERIAVYGGAAVGALSLAFSLTFWDNAVEAEVYGASMFFVALIIWCAVRWTDEADVPGNEKYLLVIAYLIGLSLGVHLLSLLAIFPILMMMYSRKYRLTARTAAIFALLAAAIFFVVYPGIVKYLPGMMDGDFAGQRGPLVAALPWLIIAGLITGTYFSYRKRRKILHVALLSALFVILGYTTYTTVLIRSNANLPMNENAPSTLGKLTAYLGREQYGDQPLFFPRRWSHERHQQRMYQEYAGDWDFLVRYQLNHMFFRYVGWNFSGREGTQQNAPVGWKSTLALPLILALLGLYRQVRVDRKMAAAFVAMFLVMGPILALYQNQQEPQPRERDYFYVGAYFVVAIWIGMGAMTVLDAARKGFASARARSIAGGAALAGLLAVVPANLLRLNWSDHDRSGNYTAWDNSYNMLQSCDQNGILFTYADNDTFPLWYLQDVEGIRRDVSIVNLSLGNLGWYIQQLKKEPYYKEALAVPMSLPDNVIEKIQPVQWDPGYVDLPVPPQAMTRYQVSDSSVIASGKIRFLMPNTLQYGRTRGIRVQDLLARDIIFANNWNRPVYFAVTCTPDCRIGLDDFLWYQGLVMELRPVRIERENDGISAAALRSSLFEEPAEPFPHPRLGYRFRRSADPSVHLDETSWRTMASYRSCFFTLAAYQQNTLKDSAGVVATLNRMESVIPHAKYQMNLPSMSYTASLYLHAGDRQGFNRWADEIEPLARAQIQAGVGSTDPRLSPVGTLMDIYRNRKEYAKLAGFLDTLAAGSPQNAWIRQEAERARQMVQQQKDTAWPGQ